ncbi:aldose 1-epimerase [Paraflavitalea pollutisoli]|uniref:aldose 1-epimerase n=1 Tax=Paraflavitalea pollutisoli TaxID=3034143 RepID=UPI0023EB3F18|nr:aldose 1-epimerase [Paraflavitalea sp. H1-2-19X]
MSFTIDRYRINDLSILRLQDKATGAMVGILPEHGALLHAFEIPVGGKPFNVVDNYPDRASLDQELTLSYKSAKLSPFPCRIANGRYEYEGEHYEFPRKFVDGTAIHGLLADKPFQLLNHYADDQMAAATFRYHYDREDPGYPFTYNCELRYTLHPNNVLQLQTTLLNLDDRTIPIADGWHPYFALGGSVNDQELQFSSDTMLEFDDRLIPTGEVIKVPDYLQPAPLGHRQLDNCFVLEVQEGMPCCLLRNPANGLSLSIYTNVLYPYLQIYTPDHRRSIAIENLSSAPDCFNNGMNVHLLAPRASLTFNVWYQLSVE